MYQELAKAVTSEAIFVNWQFYTLLFFLTLIGTIAGSFLKEYVGKKGQQLATKEDFDELKTQLKETTNITAQIQNDIEHQVWRKQQIETLRRQKLEELLVNMYAARENIERQTKKLYAGIIEDLDSSAYNKSIMLTLLYFPELIVEHNNFVRSHQKAKEWFADGVKERYQGEISQNHRDKLIIVLNSLAIALAEIEKKSHRVAMNWNQVQE
jgi:hypothetical protein